MMECRDQGQPELLDLEYRWCQRLVVVHDVELVGASAQQLDYAPGKRQWLRESAGAHPCPLLDVDAVAELAGPRVAERRRLGVEVHARHLGEVNARIQLGVRLPGEPLHAVSECRELPLQVAQGGAL